MWPMKDEAALFEIAIYGVDHATWESETNDRLDLCQRRRAPEVKSSPGR